MTDEEKKKQAEDFRSYLKLKRDLEINPTEVILEEVYQHYKRKAQNNAQDSEEE